MKNPRNLNIVLFKKNGISLMSVIITIIVLILLASVTLFSGLNIPKQAGLTRFVSEIDAIEKMIIKKCVEIENRTGGNNSITKEQLYCAIANGIDWQEVSNKPYYYPMTRIGKTFLGSNFKGTKYYPIVDEELLQDVKLMSGSNEEYCVTNEGEVFALPGLQMKVNGEMRWYVSANRYYIGDAVNLALLPSVEDMIFLEKYLTNKYANSIIEENDILIKLVGDYFEYKGRVYKFVTDGHIEGVPVSIEYTDIDKSKFGIYDNGTILVTTDGLLHNRFEKTEEEYVCIDANGMMRHYSLQGEFLGKEEIAR